MLVHVWIRKYLPVPTTTIIIIIQFSHNDRKSRYVYTIQNNLLLMRSLITLGVMRTCKLASPGTYDSLILQVGDSTIKHKHWLNLVEEKLANTMKQSEEVSIRQRIPMWVLEALHYLVQPNGHVYDSVKVSAYSQIMKRSYACSALFKLFQLYAVNYPEKSNINAKILLIWQKTTHRTHKR